MKRLSSLIFMGSKRYGQKCSHTNPAADELHWEFFAILHALPTTLTFLKLPSLILSKAACLAGDFIQQKAF